MNALLFIYQAVYPAVSHTQRDFLNSLIMEDTPIVDMMNLILADDIFQLVY